MFNPPGNPRDLWSNHSEWSSCPAEGEESDVQRRQVRRGRTLRLWRA